MNKTVLVAALGAVAALAGAPTAYATTDMGQLGDPIALVDGPVVQSWTVSGLRPSTDSIPYPVAGRLWEATAGDTAVQGSATPVVPGFSARTGSGRSYRALFEVATAQGVNPATRQPGQSRSGKVYFDVTGDAPDRVVYTIGGQDRLAWTAPPDEPAPQRPVSVTPAPASSVPAARPPAVSPPPPAAPNPWQGTPLTPWQGTPLPASTTPAAS